MPEFRESATRRTSPPYFLKNIDKLDQKQRIELVSKVGPKGETNFEPDGLVFTEDPSTLLGAAARVTSW